jgi:hypothetical protein
MSMMLSDSDEEADVTLVWDWLLHYPKCSREFWVHPMKKNRMTDNVILSSLEELLKTRKQILPLYKNDKRNLCLFTINHCSCYAKTGYKFSNKYYPTGKVAGYNKSGYFILL